MYQSRGVITIFSKRATGFHSRTKPCWTELLYKNFICSNWAGKIILTASQFAHCPALNETQITPFMRVVQIFSSTTRIHTNIYWQTPPVLEHGSRPQNKHYIFNLPQDKASPNKADIFFWFQEFLLVEGSTELSCITPHFICHACPLNLSTGAK